MMSVFEIMRVTLMCLSIGTPKIHVINVSLFQMEN